MILELLTVLTSLRELVGLVGLVNFDGPVRLVGLVKISCKRTRLGDLFDHEGYFVNFLKTI